LALEEEQRRRQAELEAMRRAQEEEAARRKAWDEYNMQQANAKALMVLTKYNIIEVNIVI
jgi:hypothetical protein